MSHSFFNDFLLSCTTPFQIVKPLTSTSFLLLLMIKTLHIVPLCQNNLLLMKISPLNSFMVEWDEKVKHAEQHTTQKVDTSLAATENFKTCQTRELFAIVRKF